MYCNLPGKIAKYFTLFNGLPKEDHTGRSSPLFLPPCPSWEWPNPD